MATVNVFPPGFTPSRAHVNPVVIDPRQPPRHLFAVQFPGVTGGQRFGDLRFHGVDLLNWLPPPNDWAPPFRLDSAQAYLLSQVLGPQLTEAATVHFDRCTLGGRPLSLLGTAALGNFLSQFVWRGRRIQVVFS